jgi:hypothetical protein
LQTACDCVRVLSNLSPEQPPMTRAKRGEIESVYILGAGFSWYANMPLQENFTRSLLEGRGAGTGPSGRVVQFLRCFVGDVFFHADDAWAIHWPELEDLFTCVDLSANSGHHLGKDYSPLKLRTVRRALIFRIITMLREKYSEAKQKPDTKWQELERYLKSIDIERSAFICTNWDTVLESRLFELFGIKAFDYRCGALGASFPSKSGSHLRRAREHKVGAIPIIKMHGSTNWLYCDNCRQTIWFPPNQSGKVAGQLLRTRDWQTIHSAKASSSETYSCTRCSADSLGTRLATFSYLKALDFPMFQKSWFSAEALLRESKRWIFIGYSLPAADFEFKFLLKRVQLSRPKAPSFTVISGGAGAEASYWNYQRFFGRAIKKGDTFFDGGLAAALLDGH